MLLSTINKTEEPATTRYINEIDTRIIPLLLARPFNSITPILNHNGIDTPRGLGGNCWDLAAEAAELFDNCPLKPLNTEVALTVHSDHAANLIQTSTHLIHYDPSSLQTSCSVFTVGEYSRTDVSAYPISEFGMEEYSFVHIPKHNLIQAYSTTELELYPDLAEPKYTYNLDSRDKHFGSLPTKNIAYHAMRYKTFLLNVLLPNETQIRTQIRFPNVDGQIKISTKVYEPRLKPVLIDFTATETTWPTTEVDLIQQHTQVAFAEVICLARKAHKILVNEVKNRRGSQGR